MIFKRIVSLILMFSIPSFAIFPDYTESKVVCTSLVEEMSALTYDDAISLIAELESGELEKRCDVNDLERLNNFLALCARQGVLPNDVDEADLIEQDIQELLQIEPSNQFAHSLDTDSKYMIVPAVYCGGADVVLCKSWAAKQWKQAKHFVKKHKKAIIIGAAVVVAAVAVVCIVAAAPVAAAAAGAAAGEGGATAGVAGAVAGAGALGTALSAESSDKEKIKEAPMSCSDVAEAVQEQIIIQKEVAVEEHIFYDSDGLPGHDESDIVCRGNCKTNNPRKIALLGTLLAQPPRLLFKYVLVGRA